MRYLLPVILLVFLNLGSVGQTPRGYEEGVITYITSQNVYVKFSSTEGISSGDSLFMMRGDKLVPMLVVAQHSSISCVCTPISDVKLNVSDKIVARVFKAPAPKVAETPAVTVVPPPIVQPFDTVVAKKTVETKSRQRITGYVSAASYSNFSNTSAANTQRMQYTFSFIGNNFGNSGFSAECYLTYNHNPSSGSEVKSDVFNSFKIYNLNLSYEFNKHFKLWLGRRINPNITNVGAVDGLQFEMQFKPISIGIIAGSRPDYRDYSFNFGLLQYGAYVAHEVKTKNGPVQTTLGFIEQTNAGKTDRRFAYLQHTNTLIPNVSFFGSAEVDFYRLVLDTKDSTYKQNSSPKLSNLYLSLRWRIIRQISISLSYSSRQNVIYYETYKNYLDQLLAQETTQGYLFQVTLRPATQLSLGGTVGYRFQQSDPRPSKNFNGYLTYSRIPWLGVSATLTVTLIETSYISGNVYGFGISRDLVPGKLFGSVNYRYDDYTFQGEEAKQLQNVCEVDLNWRILKKLSCTLYFEGTFEKQFSYQRIYFQITQRF